MLATICRSALVALIVGLPISADDGDPEGLSAGAKKAIAESRANVLKAKKVFLDAARSETKTLVAALQKELEAETKKGNLDGALAIRDQIQAFKDGELLEMTDVEAEELVESSVDSEPAIPSSSPSIQSFAWVGKVDDKVDRHNEVRPGGGPDYHFELSLSLPRNTTLRDVSLTSAGSNGHEGWTTRPEPFKWIVGVYHKEDLLARTHVSELAKLSGRVKLDLYAQPSRDLEPGHEFDVKVTAYANGKERTLVASCKMEEKKKTRRR